MAAGAAAPKRLDKRIYILLAVVVGDFIAFMDGSFRKQEDASFDDPRFCVGATGVISVASDISSIASKNGLIFTDLEQIPTAHAIRLVVRNDGAPVLDQKAMCGNSLSSKKTVSCSAFFHDERIHGWPRKWVRHTNGRQYTRKTPCQRLGGVRASALLLLMGEEVDLVRLSRG